MSNCIDHGKHNASVLPAGYLVQHRRNYRGRRDVKTTTIRFIYCDTHDLTLDDIAGKVVRHTCDNPRCINPDHLVLGTQRDNVQDMMQRNRHVPRKPIASIQPNVDVAMVMRAHGCKLAVCHGATGAARETLRSKWKSSKQPDYRHCVS